MHGIAAKNRFLKPWKQSPIETWERADLAGNVWFVIVELNYGWIVVGAEVIQRFGPFDDFVAAQDVVDRYAEEHGFILLPNKLVCML